MDMASLTDNPNRGLRHIQYGGYRTPRSNADRGSGHRTTGVTVVCCDPAYLARYGSDRAIAAANRNARQGWHGEPGTVGNARVIRRNASRRDLRALVASSVTS